MEIVITFKPDEFGIPKYEKVHFSSIKTREVKSATKEKMKLKKGWDVVYVKPHFIKSNKKEP